MDRMVIMKPVLLALLVFFFTASSHGATEQGASCELLLEKVHAIAAEVDREKTKFWKSYEDLRKRYIVRGAWHWARFQFRELLRVSNKNSVPAHLTNDGTLGFANWYARSGTDMADPILDSLAEKNKSPEKIKEELEFTEKSVGEVNGWIKKYSSLKPDLDEIFRRILVYRAQVKVLKFQLEQRDSEFGRGPIVFQMPEVRDGKVSFFNYRVNNRTDLKVKMAKVEEEHKKMTGSWLASGRLQERLYEQALLRSRLEILRDRLEFHKSLRGSFSQPDREATLVVVGKLLTEPQFFPRAEDYHKLQSKLFWSEFRDVFRTIRQVDAVRKATGVYDFITEAEKIDLGIVKPATFLPKLRLALLGLAVSTVTGGGFFVLDYSDLVRTHNQVHRELGRKKTEPDFEKGLEEHLRREYWVEVLKTRYDDNHVPFAEKSERGLEKVYEEMLEIRKQRNRGLAELERDKAFREKAFGLYKEVVVLERRVDLASTVDSQAFERGLALYILEKYPEDYVVLQNVGVRVSEFSASYPFVSEALLVDLYQIARWRTKFDEARRNNLDLEKTKDELFIDVLMKRDL
ncbi:MAG: hypothetical protein AB1540_11845 [Bdellovibrionota bacterium]